MQSSSSLFWLVILLIRKFVLQSAMDDGAFQTHATHNPYSEKRIVHSYVNRIIPICQSLEIGFEEASYSSYFGQTIMQHLEVRTRPICKSLEIGFEEASYSSYFGQTIMQHLEVRTRSSSRQVRIRVPSFLKGTLPQKEGTTGHYWRT